MTYNPKSVHFSPLRTALAVGVMLAVAALSQGADCDVAVDYPASVVDAGVGAVRQNKAIAPVQPEPVSTVNRRVLQCTRRGCLLFHCDRERQLPELPSNTSPLSV